MYDDYSDWMVLASTELGEVLYRVSKASGWAQLEVPYDDDDLSMSWEEAEEVLYIKTGVHYEYVDCYDTIHRTTVMAIRLAD